jgi:hypothetical protein
MPTQEELLQRIRHLELENSELQDKLDMIYSIVAPPDEDDADADLENDADADKDVLVQISFEKKKGVN